MIGDGALNRDQEFFAGMKCIFMLLSGAKTHSLQRVSRIPSGWRAEAFIGDLVVRNYVHAERRLTGVGKRERPQRLVGAEQSLTLILRSFGSCAKI